MNIDRTFTSPHNQGNWGYVGDRTYVLGPNPDERLAYADVNGAVYYPHADRQGSTIAISISGQNVLTRTYGPYGELAASNANVTIAPGASAYPFLYTGQRYEPFLAAYDYKARIYDGKDGRFWQPDPIGTKDDLNLYAYVKDDPINATDPSGQNCNSLIATCRMDEPGSWDKAANRWMLTHPKEVTKIGNALTKDYRSLLSHPNKVVTRQVPMRDGSRQPMTGRAGDFAKLMERRWIGIQLDQSRLPSGANAATDFDGRRSWVTPSLANSPTLERDLMHEYLHGSRPELDVYKGPLPDELRRVHQQSYNDFASDLLSAVGSQK